MNMQVNAPELTDAQKVIAMSAALQTIGRQRDSAMNDCASLNGQLALAQAEISELKLKLQHERGTDTLERTAGLKEQ